MISKELLELKEVLEAEREALIKGAIEEILKWASYKSRLILYLKDKEFSLEERNFLEEIKRLNERNQQIIQAGLNFIEEAYKFLTGLLYEKETYGREDKKLKKEDSSLPKIISKVI
ncbi:MAG: flagellar protein FlgN [Thermodesulfobacteriaceae bacterium]|nr:flagellar protein FlgN [Thermodesulfobacteriaceae bacterium]MCX8041288.1 flagellar protein FlgN [Thermodesulfobacteriaceae bacterium]MDW8135447.1 hypothetical protein [Thermodesulfobacterium sp.]